MLGWETLWMFLRGLQGPKTLVQWKLTPAGLAPCPHLQTSACPTGMTGMTGTVLSVQTQVTCRGFKYSSCENSQGVNELLIPAWSSHSPPQSDQEPYDCNKKKTKKQTRIQLDNSACSCAAIHPGVVSHFLSLLAPPPRSHSF